MRFVDLSDSWEIGWASNFCSNLTVSVSCDLAPDRITLPNGARVTLGWDVSQVSNTFYDYRLNSVSTSYGYAIGFTYQTDTWVAPGGTWHVRTRSDFYNNAVSASAQASVSYAYPSSYTVDLIDMAGSHWLLYSGVTSTSVQRPGESSPYFSATLNTSGLVTAVTNDGVTTNYSRSVVGSTGTETITDALTHQTVVTSDLNIGRPTSINDPLNRTTSFTYDTSGRLTRITQPEGNYVQYTLDSRGNATQTQAVAKAGSGLPAVTTSAAYPSSCTNILTCNEPTSTTDARGNTTDYTYDSNHGGVLTVTRPAATTGGVRPQTRHSYTQFGTGGRNGFLYWLPSGISECQTTASCSGAADEVKSTIVYDSNANATSVSKGNGSGTLTATSAMTYDAMGNLLTVDGPLSGTADTTKFQYDAARRQTGKMSPDPDGAGSLKNRELRTTYDSAGRTTRRELGTVNSDWTGFVAAQTVDVTYSGARVATQKLSAGGTAYALSQFSYDSLGRPDCRAARMNPAIYGSLPSSACTLGTSGSFGPDRISQTVYDAASEPTQLKVAVGTSDAATERTLTYSNNGKLATLLDGENNLTTFEYDGFDRPSKTRYPSTTKGSGTSSATDNEQFAFDGNSNMIAYRNRAGALFNFTYDNLDRLTLRDLPSPESDVTYSYDLLGRMTGASQGGFNLTFGYDALSRQTSDGQGWGTISHSFDLAGRTTRTTWQDGFYVDYDRLVTGEMTKARENGASSGVGVLATYSYDDLGRRTGVTYGNGAAQAYSYDGVSRLASLTNDLSGTSNDLSVTFAYNPASQITQSVRTGDAYAWTGHGTGSTSYTQNGLNQQITVGGTSTTHDANGNLTYEPQSAKTYAYSSENRLNSSSGGTGTSLYYDPLGRIAEYDTTVSSRFMSDGGEVAVEVDGSSNIVRRFVRGDGSDELIAWYEGSGTTTRRFAGLDERGSVISATDASGTLIGINAYDEYGKPQSTNIGRMQYTGQLWLPQAQPLLLQGPQLRAAARTLRADGPGRIRRRRAEPLRLGAE